MRRALLIGGFAAATAVGGGAWYLGARREAGGDVQLGLIRPAFGVIALGAAVILSGAVVALRHRHGARTTDELDDAPLSPPATRPAIIIHHHGRRRRPDAPIMDTTLAPAPFEADDEPEPVLDAIRAALGHDEPTSLVLTGEALTARPSSLDQFVCAAVELLAERGMTVPEAISMVLDRAGLTTDQAVDVAALVGPGRSSNGPAKRLLSPWPPPRG
jgi:hypothetical protein